MLIFFTYAKCPKIDKNVISEHRKKVLNTQNKITSIHFALKGLESDLKLLDEGPIVTKTCTLHPHLKPTYIPLIRHLKQKLKSMSSQERLKDFQRGLALTFRMIAEHMKAYQKHDNQKMEEFIKQVIKLNPKMKHLTPSDLYAANKQTTEWAVAFNVLQMQKKKNFNNPVYETVMGIQTLPVHALVKELKKVPPQERWNYLVKKMIQSEDVKKNQIRQILLGVLLHKTGFGSTLRRVSKARIVKYFMKGNSFEKTAIEEASTPLMYNIDFYDPKNLKIISKGDYFTKKELKVKQLFDDYAKQIRLKFDSNLYDRIPSEQKQSFLNIMPLLGYYYGAKSEYLDHLTRPQLTPNPESNSVVGDCTGYLQAGLQFMGFPKDQFSQIVKGKAINWHRMTVKSTLDPKNAGTYKALKNKTLKSSFVCSELDLVPGSMLFKKGHAFVFDGYEEVILNGKKTIVPRVCEFPGIARGFVCEPKTDLHFVRWFSYALKKGVYKVLEVKKIP